jgi:hypothetical protein
MLSLITQAVLTVFFYCTDFMINVANMTGLSYYEVNTLIFCFLWPVVSVLLIGLSLIQRRRLKQAIKREL